MAHNCVRDENGMFMEKSRNTLNLAGMPDIVTVVQHFVGTITLLRSLSTVYGQHRKLSHNTIVTQYLANVVVMYPNFRHVQN